VVLQDWALQNHYAIYPQYLHRYAPGVTHNTERVFGLCVPTPMPVRLSPREHTDSVWLPWQEAAQQVFSASNAVAIERLPNLTNPGERAC
jgi:dihydroneopterin triphosphate diphosphatase